MIPAIQECVYEFVSHSIPQQKYRLLQSVQTLNENELSILEDKSNEMKEKKYEEYAKSLGINV